MDKDRRFRHRRKLNRVLEEWDRLPDKFQELVVLEAMIRSAGIDEDFARGELGPVLVRRKVARKAAAEKVDG